MSVGSPSMLGNLSCASSTCGGRASPTAELPCLVSTDRERGERGEVLEPALSTSLCEVLEVLESAPPGELNLELCFCKAPLSSPLLPLGSVVAALILLASFLECRLLVRGIIILFLRLLPRLGCKLWRWTRWCRSEVPCTSGPSSSQSALRVSLPKLPIAASSGLLAHSCKTGAATVSAFKRRSKCRFISSCILCPSKSFGSVPNGFSISIAIKFKHQKMNTWIKTKMKAQTGEVTHCDITNGATNQCMQRTQSHV
mmetsp:Transcript_23983/g.55359  ORF Transcript_23983/g.55359 Transcript_23983/m.55359 type:complete len:256 (+) Transcript_23983:253-1020(+)